MAGPGGIANFSRRSLDHVKGRLRRCKQNWGERDPLPLLMNLTSTVCSEPGSLLSRGFVSPASAKHLVDGCLEMACPSWSGDLAAQNGPVGNIFPVIGAR